MENVKRFNQFLNEKNTNYLRESNNVITEYDSFIKL